MRTMTELERELATEAFAQTTVSVGSDDRINEETIDSLQEELDKRGLAIMRAPCKECGGKGLNVTGIAVAARECSACKGTGLAPLGEAK